MLMQTVMLQVELSFHLFGVIIYPNEVIEAQEPIHANLPQSYFIDFLKVIKLLDGDLLS